MMKLTGLFLATAALSLAGLGNAAAQAATPTASVRSPVPGGELACIAANVWFDDFLVEMRASAGSDQKQLAQVNDLEAAQPRSRAMFQGRLSVLKDDGHRKQAYAAATADLNKLDRMGKLQRVVDCKKWELELTKMVVGSMVPAR